MSDKFVEKNFLYLLTLSVLLHLAVFQLISLLPPAKEKSWQEPTMVDLTELPEPPPVPPAKSRPQPPKPEAEVKRFAERRQRVIKETAPKGDLEVERSALQPPATPRQSQAPQAPAQAARREAEPRPSAPSVPGETQRREPVARGEGIFKPGTQPAIDRSQLFPSAGKLARLEESYRKKYDREVEDGSTRFLNTNDIQFGSFLRRFETAVYGVWHYPQAALVRGIEGTTPVRITFSRSGEITRVELLESSGSPILDDEVLRTLKQLGPIGSFPRGYTGEGFKLIAFFQYGIGGGRLR